MLQLVFDPRDAQHIKFSSIEHFRSFLKELRRHYRDVAEDEIPKSFLLEGTVKLHGTHADLVFRKCACDDGDDVVWKVHCQSRNRVLSLDQDNCGFANFVAGIPCNVLLDIVRNIEAIYRENTGNDATEVMVAGEFCGNDVQPKVALTQLDKMFVIFDVKIDGQRQDFAFYRVVECEKHAIYNIHRGGLFNATLEWNDSEAVVPILQNCTEKVEKECPFAKTFGIIGMGEGVVWRCRVPRRERDGYLHDSRFWFKVKGEEHAVSNVKTLKSSPRNDIKNANDFIAKAVLPARLQQGMDHLREMNLDHVDMKNLGTYLSWVVKDVFKEEGDVAEALGLDPKMVKWKISEKAKRYYLNNMKNENTSTASV